MKIARVTGTVVSTIAHRDLGGQKLLLCDLLDLKGAPTGAYQMALDTVGAGVGETVLLLDEGNGARQILGSSTAPVRTVVAGIIDRVTVDD
ncbi:MAG: EutN/CcmL family microcompartment protein [Acidobacteriota bacterium]